VLDETYGIYTLAIACELGCGVGAAVGARWVRNRWTGRREVAQVVFVSRKCPGAALLWVSRPWALDGDAHRILLSSPRSHAISSWRSASRLAGSKHVQGSSARFPLLRCKNMCSRRKNSQELASALILTLVEISTRITEPCCRRSKAHALRSYLTIFAACGGASVACPCWIRTGRHVSTSIRGG
jgi:hypothetical protein